MNLWKIIWHFVTPFPYNASGAQVAARNFRNLIAALAVYWWASTGQGQEPIKLFIGYLTIPAIYISTLGTGIAGVGYLADSWDSFNRQYEEYYRQRSAKKVEQK